MAVRVSNESRISLRVTSREWWSFHCCADHDPGLAGRDWTGRRYGSRSASNRASECVCVISQSSSACSINSGTLIFWMQIGMVLDNLGKKCLHTDITDNVSNLWTRKLL